MPVFYPDNVQTNSPSINPIVLGSSNHISGFGFFDSVSSGNTNRDDVGSNFRAPGYLAVVFDSTSVTDSEMYIYASTNLTDGAWTTSANWKSFEGASNTNLATNNLTQGNENRTYDIPTGRILTFQGAGNEKIELTSNSIDNSNKILLKAGQLQLSTAGAGAGRMAFLDGDESAAVTLSAPTTVSSEYTLTLPALAAGADRLIQSNSTGTLSYAELSFTTNTLVIGAQSVDISAAGTNTNLATDNLTQNGGIRTYSLETSDQLKFVSSDASSTFQLTDISGAITASVTGDENSKLIVNGGAGTRLFGFTPNTSQSGNVVLKAPPGYTEGGIFYIDSDQLKFATPSYDAATEQLVIGTNSTDIGDVNTNIAFDSLTQSNSNRTYTLSEDYHLDFATSGSGKLRVQDSSGEMAVTIEGSESSYIGVFGGTANVFGFSPNTSQGGNCILKAPPGYTEGGIWYNESNQIKFATPSFDSATSQLVIGTNSTVISSSGSNLGNSDLTSTDSERKYGIGATSLAFTNAADTLDIFLIRPDSVDIGNSVPLRLFDDGGGQYVGLDVPASVTDYTITLPDAVASADRVLQTDSSGNLSYAELTFASNTLTLGQQSVELSFTGENLATANLTQDEADRTYDIGNGTLTFKEGSDNIVKIDSTPAGTFAAPYLVTFEGFQTIVPQTAGGGLLLDVDSDYITNDRFWGEIVELAPEASTFSVGQIVTFDGSNGLTTAINSDATRSSLSMFMAVTASATKRVMTRGYICLATSKVTGLSSTSDAGKPVYVDSTAGKMTITTPSGGAYMRLVGHIIQVNQGNSNCTIYFNPEGSVFKTI